MGLACEPLMLQRNHYSSNPVAFKQESPFFSPFQPKGLVAYEFYGISRQIPLSICVVGDSISRVPGEQANKTSSLDDEGAGLNLMLVIGQSPSLGVGV